MRRSEVAELVGVNVRTVDKWGKRGLLTPIRLAQTTRYRRDEIETLMNEEKNVKKKTGFVVKETAGTYEQLRAEAKEYFGLELGDRARAILTMTDYLMSTYHFDGSRRDEVAATVEGVVDEAFDLIDWEGE